MLKLSVFTVMLPDLTPEEAGVAIKEAGYDGIEWRVTTPRIDTGAAPSFWMNNFCTLDVTEADAKRARQIGDDNGLALPGLGTYINVGDVELTERAMNFARICGAPQVRINPGRWPEPGISYAESFDRARRYLAECQQLARRYSIRAIVEIHHGTLTPSAALAHRLVSEFDPQYIGVLYDSGNMVFEGYEHYDMGLQLLGPYLSHVHVKNAAYSGPDTDGVWRANWAPLAEGVVDWAAFFGALKKNGYDGWVGLEDFSGTYPSREALAQDMALLKAQIEKAY